MKLKDYLEKENITMDEFAAMTDMSKNNVWQIANGRKSGKRVTRIIVAATNGEVTAEELKGGVPTKEWVTRYKKSRTSE